MRTILGYLAILMIIPALAFLIKDVYEEYNQYIPLEQYLDTHISVDKISLHETSYITAADGQIISEISNGEKRIQLSYEEIPSILKDTSIIVEDQHFFQHQGIDFIAIGRAILINVEKDNIEQGGSTITQQLARNLYLNQEKTYNRKLMELLYSYQLERNYSKERILELYLNAIYFGNGAYGIEAAARTYFNKNSSQLSEAELVFLAAIPNNPSLYNPKRHFENTKKRQERILNQLVTAEKLSSQKAEELRNTTITLTPEKTIDLYPDYVTYVEEEVRQLVANQHGLTDALESKDPDTSARAKEQVSKLTTQLLESGVTIHTALDQNIQQLNQRTLKQSIAAHDIEASAVVIQHDTHELVSLTGAKDYQKYSFHRGFQSYRQPGSTIKPLLVYGPYIDSTNAEITESVDASSYCIQGYCPENSGGGSYGSVSMKQAFAQSYNTPAVRLLHKNGLQKSFAYLENFHFKKVDEHDYRLPSALGGLTYGVTPLELTSAFTSFYDGNFQTPRAIRKIADKDGDILYQWNDKPVKVWKEPTVRKMRTLLTAVIDQGTAKQATYSHSGYYGGKTGTTNGVNDLWFVGLNSQYTTGVWVGKDQPGTISHLSNPQLQIWKTIMSNID